MPVPANISYDFTLQDNRGFKANMRVEAFSPDISIDTSVTGAIYTGMAGMITAIANLTNTKVVKAAWGFSFDYAQEPATETGTYELVTQKAVLRWGDGNGGFALMSVPGPVDAAFLTTGQDKLIVIDPTSGLIEALQDAFEDASVFKTARGGVPLSQFFGGQYRGERNRVRRVVQGA